jgi:putative transposase
MAVWRRGKPKQLLHHSDQGSQYSSEQFQRLMADSGIVCSMSRFGNVWDNVAMESFFASLKTERTARKTYRTRNEAKADVFDYIERFYNAVRRHSTIGYVSPVEHERKAGLISRPLNRQQLVPPLHLVGCERAAGQTRSFSRSAIALALEVNAGSQGQLSAPAATHTSAAIRLLVGSAVIILFGVALVVYQR